MTIDLTTLPSGAFEFVFAVDDLLPDRVTGDKATIKGEYTKTNGGVDIQGELELDIKFNCDSCFAPSVQNIKIEVDEFFKTTDDGEHYTYNGNTIDLTQLVTDYVLFATAGRLLCKPDCEGLSGVYSGDQAEGNFEEEETQNPFAVLKDIGGEL